MATFLIAHGGWSGGWYWKKMRPRMFQHGHDFHAPTLTGISERRHQGSPDTDLSTHVRDLLEYMEFEDLNDVILVGHSYGGMVATVVADKAPSRILELVYLDAFVPRDGQCLCDLQPEHVRRAAVEGAKLKGDGWLIPPLEPTPDTSEADLRWMTPRKTGQPIKTFLEPARLGGAVERLPRTYVYATSPRSYDVFKPFAERAKSESGWTFMTIDSTHSPMITAPDLLMEVLGSIAARVSARQKP